jgi:hypothetical protein
MPKRLFHSCLALCWVLSAMAAPPFVGTYVWKSGVSQFLPDVPGEARLSGFLALQEDGRFHFRMEKGGKTDTFTEGRWLQSEGTVLLSSDAATPALWLKQRPRAGDCSVSFFHVQQDGSTLPLSVDEAGQIFMVLRYADGSQVMLGAEKGDVSGIRRWVPTAEIQDMVVRTGKGLFFAKPLIFEANNSACQFEFIVDKAALGRISFDNLALRQEGSDLRLPIPGWRAMALTFKRESENP